MGLLDGAANGASLGAEAGPWGALAGGVLGAAFSFLSGDNKANLQRQQTDEQVRRFQDRNAQTQGQATAAGYASGTTGQGSLSMYLNDMSTEFRRQSDWMRQAGYAQADATQSASTFGLASDIGGSLFKFGASQNWFKSPGV